MLIMSTVMPTIIPTIIPTVMLMMDNPVVLGCVAVELGL